MSDLIAQIKERIWWHSYYEHDQTVKVLYEALHALEKQNDPKKSLS